MKSFFKPLIAVMGLVAILFSCQNELPFNTENSESINVTTRAVIPADAVAIPDTTTVFQFQNNTPYYIPAGDTVSAGYFNSTSYDGVNLYVEGIWEMPNENVLTIPPGVNVTVVNAGVIICRTAQYVDIPRDAFLFIADGGRFLAEGRGTIYLGINGEEKGGTITNYGVLALRLLDAREGYFYNLNPAIFSYNTFFEPNERSHFLNTGTLVQIP